MPSSDENPFAELPEALVEDMLEESKRLSSYMKQRFQDLFEKRQDLRSKLVEKSALLKESSKIQTPCYPTSCGIDGSYHIERLLATDLVATAALAVEGLTPPTETRHWERPRHRQFVEVVPHHESNGVIARAIMIAQELAMASKAPHDIVFIDGSLRTPVIYLNQALSKAEAMPEVSGKLLSILPEALGSYDSILSSSRNDKAYVGVPKYTSKKEISEGLLGLRGHEDRGLLSFLMEASELTQPMPIGKEMSDWHLGNVPEELEETSARIESLLSDVYVFYYKPFQQTPALRVEISKNIATNDNRLATVLEAIKMQSGAPRLMEPYPLYLADRMVKHLSTALPAIRKTITQGIAEEWTGNLGEVYLAMHAYRSDSRR